MSSQRVVFVVSRYVDVAAAAGDFRGISVLYADVGSTDSFDAVIVGRKGSGEARMYDCTEIDAAADEPEGGLASSSGVAAGLAMSLVPDIGAGAAMDAAASEHVRLAAGNVTRAIDRGTLRALGEFLDDADAALVIATDDRMATSICQALRFAESTIRGSTNSSLQPPRSALHPAGPQRTSET